MRISIDASLAGTRLDKLLVDQLPGLGRAGARRLFERGLVQVSWAEGKVRKGAKGDVARAGETVLVELEEDLSSAALPEPAAPLEVALETEQLVVLAKPAGQPTAPLLPGEKGTLVNALVGRYPALAEFGFSPREPGIVHRLDTETSGLVLAGKTRAAFEALSAALKDSLLDKRYLLLCKAEGLAETGSIDIPLAPHPKDRRRVYACSHPRDVQRLEPREASTSWTVQKVVGPWALVEAKAPRAFRHQIRAHFAAIGHPLAGDALYGGEAVPGLERHALHAHYIAFRGDRTVPAFTVTAPLPADLRAVLQAAGEAPDDAT